MMGGSFWGNTFGFTSTMADLRTKETGVATLFLRQFGASRNLQNNLNSVKRATSEINCLQSAVKMKLRRMNWLAC